MTNTKEMTKPCGLANLGNTCFINTTLQCLCRVLDFFPKKETLDPNSLLYEWISLTELMNDNTGVINPKRFLHILQLTARNKNRILFSGFAQNDLPEFILFLFEMFHETLKHKVTINIKGYEVSNTDKLAKKTYEMIKSMYAKEYSNIIRDFYGVSVTTIQDENKTTVLSQTPEPFFLLDLPILRNNATLEECMQEYTKEELLKNENSWYNSNTKSKQNALKSIGFFNLPNILIISLKRFSNHIRKLNHHIEFPVDTLDMSPYMCGYTKNYKYELIGIANHAGSVMGGHYFAYVKLSDGEWFKCNDSHISPLRRSQLISNHAYCLFYKKL